MHLRDRHASSPISPADTRKSAPMPGYPARCFLALTLIYRLLAAKPHANASKSFTRRYFATEPLFVPFLEWSCTDIHAKADRLDALPSPFFSPAAGLLSGYRHHGAATHLQHSGTRALHT